MNPITHAEEGSDFQRRNLKGLNWVVVTGLSRPVDHRCAANWLPRASGHASIYLLSNK